MKVLDPAAAFEKRAARAAALVASAPPSPSRSRSRPKLFRLQGRLAAAVSARHAGRAVHGRRRPTCRASSTSSPRFCRSPPRTGPPELAEAAESVARGRPTATAATRLSRLLGRRARGPRGLPVARVPPAVRRGSRTRGRRGRTAPARGPLPGLRLRPDRLLPQGAARIQRRRALPRLRALRDGVGLQPASAAPPARKRTPRSCRASRATSTRTSASRPARRAGATSSRIDLTLDARPLPEVDDLVSLAMDLWAIEEGWTRLEPGWAGI